MFKGTGKSLGFQGRNFVGDAVPDLCLEDIVVQAAGGEGVLHGKEIVGSFVGGRWVETKDGLSVEINPE